MENPAQGIALRDNRFTASMNAHGEIATSFCSSQQHSSLSLLSSMISTSDGIKVVCESNECYAHGLQLLAASFCIHLCLSKKWVRHGLLCQVYMAKTPVCPGDFGDDAGIFGAQQANSSGSALFSSQTHQMSAGNQILFYIVKQMPVMEWSGF